MSRAADESPTRPPPASPATDDCSHRRRQTAAAKLPATGADSCGRTSPTVGSGSSRRTSWQDLVVVVSLYTGYCLGLLLLLVSVAGTGESQVSSFLKHYTKVYCIVYIVPLSLEREERESVDRCFVGVLCSTKAYRLTGSWSGTLRKNWGAENAI